MKTLPGCVAAALLVLGLTSSVFAQAADEDKAGPVTDPNVPVSPEKTRA